MTKTSFADCGALMSPRTAKYVEALMREGDNFDYQKWLQQVREEEAQVKRAFSVPGKHAATEIATPSSTSNFRNPVPNAGRAVVLKAVPVSRPIWRLHREGTSKGPKRWLEKVRDAWDDFQANRARDAVYGYLEAVFATHAYGISARRRSRRVLHLGAIAGRGVDRTHQRGG